MCRKTDADLYFPHVAQDMDVRIGRYHFVARYRSPTGPEQRHLSMDDMRGQQTGFKMKYTEHLIGWGHWIGTTVLFRPELRCERSYDLPA
jgi:hypothetical protein